MLFQKKDRTPELLLEQLGSSQDVVSKEIKSEHGEALIIYLKSLCDEKRIQQTLLKPFYETDEKEFNKYLQSIPIIQEHQTYGDILTDIMDGSVAIFINNDIYLMNVKEVHNNSLNEATVETVIQGPQYSLSESLNTNINLVRFRYPQASLRVKEYKIGKLSQTKVSVMYDKKLASQNVIKEIELGLSKIEIDVLQAAGQLQKQLTKKKRTLYPTMLVTERPDRIAYNLAQGKVVMLVDGTPFALIAPSVFYDFMSSMEDEIQSFWISQFIVSLRYIGLFISILLPSFYVAVTAYNPEFFRVQLALSIAGSRLAVPYPAFLEVFFMLLMMELLTEASVRLPKSIGSTATTVGGLILGQAAVEAGLVSNVMIIIVAAVAISNFVIPINAMQFAMRVTKYILLFLTTFFGMVGLLMGFVGIIAYLANLRSCGQPYLKLFFVPSGSKKGAD